MAGACVFFLQSNLSSLDLSGVLFGWRRSQNGGALEVIPLTALAGGVPRLALGNLSLSS